MKTKIAFVSTEEWNALWLKTRYHHRYSAEVLDAMWFPEKKILIINSPSTEISELSKLVPELEEFLFTDKEIMEAAPYSPAPR